ncbi:hypothetical protein TNIN_190771 [Trichonephila inaurata madagascariensis]|uniref:Uncharacterized protein n=1 Tax=Trichonephila inaurata madagascariensis TaxID=2747483 RepID=A0A8X6YWY7_9ARAC|nr:hypothetical protein TNIN_190771 [Trichonephila inaurata madagascariensis]
MTTCREALVMGLPQEVVAKGDQDFPPADISPKFSRYTGFSSDCCLQEFDLTLLRNSDDRSNCETQFEGLRSSSNLNKSPFTTISTKFLNPNLTKCTNYWKFHSPAQRTLATADNDIREQECNHLVFEGVKNHSVVKTEGNHGELNSIDQRHTASNIT